MILFLFPLPARDGCFWAASIFHPPLGACSLIHRPSSPGLPSPLLLCLSLGGSDGWSCSRWKSHPGARGGGVRDRAEGAEASPLRPWVASPLPVPAVGTLLPGGSWGCPRTGGGRWGPGLPLPGAPQVTRCRDPVAPSLCPGVPRACGQGWASLATGSAQAGDERARSPRGKGPSGHMVSLWGQRGRGPGCPWRGDGLLAEYLNARCGLGEAACEFGSSWAADGNHPARPSRQRDLTRGVTALIVPHNGADRTGASSWFSRASPCQVGGR